MPPQAVPVTVLTGFLGSGKTTLINRILKEAHGRRFAVIENEYGEINVDADLLVKDGGETVVQLTNGCVCCTVRGDLANALNDLALRREKGEIQFDHVLHDSAEDAHVHARPLELPNSVFGLAVVLQGIDRLGMTDAVYVAVGAWPRRPAAGPWRPVHGRPRCRRPRSRRRAARRGPRRTARKGGIRRDHLGRHARIARARRADHQGSAELPFGISVPSTPAG